MNSLLNKFYEYLSDNNNDLLNFIEPYSYNVFNKMDYSPIKNEIECQFNIRGDYLIITVHKYTRYSDFHININSPDFISISELNRYSDYISKLSTNISNLIDLIKKFVEDEI